MTISRRRLALAAACTPLLLSNAARAAEIVRAAGPAPVSAAPAASVVITPDAGAPASERARALWQSFREGEALDPRVDLIRLKFGSPASRVPGAAAVTGVSAEPELLAEFFGMLGRRGVSPESSVERLPPVEDRARLAWAVVARPDARLTGIAPEDAADTGERVRTLGAGERLQILKRAEGRALVRCEDGRLGWAAEGDLAMKNETAYVAWNRRDLIAVTRAGAEALPEGSGAPVPLPVGTLLPAGPDETGTERESGAYDIVLPDGRRARLTADAAQPARTWQRREEIRRREAPAKYLERVAATAASWTGMRGDALGMPLPAAALAAHDLVAPRDLDRLARLGAPLSGGRGGRELLPGDILFFGSGETPEAAGVWLGGGLFAAVSPETGLVARIAFGTPKVRRGAKTTKTAPNGGLGKFLWAVRPAVAELRNPCLLSTRSHPFHQAPAAGMARCRLR